MLTSPSEAPMNEGGAMEQYYRDEEKRMRAKGYSNEQIERRFDDMAHLFDLVTWLQMGGVA